MRARGNAISPQGSRGHTAADAACPERRGQGGSRPVPRVCAFAFLLATLLLQPGGASLPSAFAATSSCGTVQVAVSATVGEHLSVRVLRQAQELVVTAEDVVRGYVDVPGACRVEVRTNNPRGYLLTFEATGSACDFLAAVTVTAAGREGNLSPNGGWIPQQYVRGGAAMDIHYRFYLTDDAEPGIYRWPLSVSATRM